MSIEFLKQGGSIRVGTFLGWGRRWWSGWVGIALRLGWQVIIRLKSVFVLHVLIYDLRSFENLNVYRGGVFKRTPG